MQLKQGSLLDHARLYILGQVPEKVYIINKEESLEILEQRNHMIFPRNLDLRLVRLEKVSMVRLEWLGFYLLHFLNTLIKRMSYLNQGP